MNNYAIEKRFLRQLIHMKKEKKPSEYVLNSLYAQAMIEHAIFQFQKGKFIEAINKTLDEKDEEKFRQLAAEYNEWLNQYREGKIVHEAGYELKLAFDT